MLWHNYLLNKPGLCSGGWYTLSCLDGECLGKPVEEKKKIEVSHLQQY